MVYLGIVIAVIAIDQLTKIMVVSNFSLYEKIVIIPGYLNFTYVTNRGAAFSLLAEVDSPWRHYFFIVVSSLAVVLLTIFWLRVRQKSPFLGWGIALIAGGALGNLIDRVRSGAVIDFIDAHWHGYHWPAFNIADSAICIGVTIFMILSLFEKETSNQRR